ncbi:retron system putative HNH endonuclease [Pseudomonas sp.]|uniref:retron system putative HNH endonuclease n=1 Tax=Pseudomonas sp. TaxID=306 RepID=UPI003F2CBFEB
MRQVFKGTEPASFIQWKAEANEDWSPTYTSLQNPEKYDLHTSLLLEQGYFCCYCARDINHSSSHIEHFRPQEDYKNLALEYQNLHASCIRKKESGSPLHCGHQKDNWFDEDEHISPLEESCEKRFRYLQTGEIQATEATDTQASKMIEILALDIAYLNNRRHEIISKLFDPAFIRQASDEDFEIIANAFRSTPLSEQSAFDHVIVRYAEQLLIS